MEARAEAQIINLHWLLRLRWVAIVGQIAVVLGVELLLGITLPALPIALVIGFELVSNAASAAWVRHSRPLGSQLPACLLGIDVVLLTFLLAFTGGPMNPFSFLYMVHVALAAVTLPPRPAWSLTALSLLGYAALFWLPGQPDAAMHAHHANMQLHLQGMYVAFAVAAVFIVYFVQRVTAALAERDTELAAARNLTERHERFAALTTLIAGAAHELATPLSTIAVVAGELDRLLAPRDYGHDIIEDVRLIRAQVRRCHKILEQMAADAGPQVGESLETLPLAELLARALDGLPQRERITVKFEGDADKAILEVPLRAMLQTLRGILKNALQASSAEHAVELLAGVSERQVRLAIRDQGHGMPATVLKRAGEPFFTTKAPGEGMGLGLFLARTLLERLGGALDLASSPGHGTVVTLLLPLQLHGGASRRPSGAK